MLVLKGKGRPAWPLSPVVTPPYLNPNPPKEGVGLAS